MLALSLDTFLSGPKSALALLLSENGETGVRMGLAGSARFQQTRGIFRQRALWVSRAYQEGRKETIVTR